MTVDIPHFVYQQQKIKNNLKRDYRFFDVASTYVVQNGIELLSQAMCFFTFAGIIMIALQTLKGF